MSQSALLKSKRFAPFFITQFLGAFNDNIYKNTLMLIMTYGAADAMGLNSHIVLNLAAVLFILPFLLFSALAGQIADKYEKSALIRKIKLLEIIIMLAGGLALLTENYILLLVLLFLMGTQSAFFGPCKYAILPQHLERHELVGGNALVEMGTFVSILLATIGAGIILQFENYLTIASIMVVFLACLGYISSYFIPKALAIDSGLKLDFNILKSSLNLISYARKNRGIFLAILAISWFWFLGASYLTQFPNFSKQSLNGDPSLVTLLLATFTLGIGFGSLLCEKLSRKQVELGIVPIGALGMTLFGVDLYLAIPTNLLGLESWLTFTSNSDNWRMLIDLAGIGIFGGIFIVPLYAYIQLRVEEEYRARIIGVINIINALFLVASGLVAIVFLGIFDLSISEFFLVISIMNIVVSLYIFHQVDEFAVRFIVWILTNIIYRVKERGRHNIPEEGAAVLVSNHVSFVDALVIASTSPRPIRFVMDHNIFKNPLIGWFFRLVKAIPIASEKACEKTYKEAFDTVSQVLSEGHLVCIFPEGKLTKTGEMNEFKSGIEKIINRDPVPVIPIGLIGLWGSFFSHKEGAAFSKTPKRFWSRVKINIGPLMHPEKVSAQGLYQEVDKLCKTNL
jgi:1-acyl-sn-glycerol-3-phosphate acyltransferase